MWSDNETDKDFLNFSYVADIAAAMIANADNQPISMGISGSWGVGKSSMMKLLGHSLKRKSGRNFLFVQFNAWLYQGYDDTRAALMEIIAREILAYAQDKKGLGENLVEKAQGLLNRVNWFRAISLTASTAISLAAGLPPIGLVGEGINAVKGLVDGNVTNADISAGKEAFGKTVEESKGLLKEKVEKAPPTPPQAIHDFRAELEKTLKALDVTLVVLIDDLDRCLPQTAISTLEAMRLFLFLDNTAFIIAADDKMIRASVRHHFKDVHLDDDLVTNYFDKLIQVPIRVPPLGTQDVRAYLVMLFMQNSNLGEASVENLRLEMCKRLGESWSGKRVDRAFIESVIGTVSSDLESKLDLAERLAPLLTTAKKVAGNPRLIKRFMNTLSIRMEIAKLQNVSIDEAALAKMLLFERCGSEKAYAELLSDINESDDGRSKKLLDLEKKVASDPKAQLEQDWQDDFQRDWLAMEPLLGDVDLRGIVYVSREHLPIISSTDKLSTQGVATLEALLKIQSSVSPTLTEALGKLGGDEVSLITSRLLSKARSVSSWGTPAILFAILTAAAVPGSHQKQIASFFQQIPHPNLTAALIPALSQRDWARPVLAEWAQSSDAKQPVRAAAGKVISGGK